MTTTAAEGNPMPGDESPDQTPKICGAKTRSGGLCQQTRLADNGRCRMHGGKTPKGINSPNFKHGRWTTHLPQSVIGKGFREAYQDRTLMQLRQDAALVDALITSYTGSLKDTGRPLTLPQQDRVLALVEQRRKLVESEARRLRDLSQVVPVEQYRTALGILFRIIQEHLGDNPRAMMDVQTAARRLLMGKGPREGEADE